MYCNGLGMKLFGIHDYHVRQHVLSQDQVPFPV